MHRWLFVDLNSYFASVEQELRPELRGKPVAVVPMLADSTCAIAASYEAKAFGIKTGTLVREMKALCPRIILVEARHEHYVEFHHRIVEAVESCVPVNKVHSIDEMACQLRGSDRIEENARALALEIKNAIKSKVGSTLRASIGIAPNRYLAKIATDMQKPDGLTCLRLDDLPGSLMKLKLRDLPGVGSKMEQKLNRSGIQTMQQLLALSRESMRATWGGVWGERVYDWLRGKDFDLAESTRRSMSQSHVLPPRQRTPERARQVAHRLVSKAALRLRKKSLWTKGLSLSVSFLGYENAGHEKKYFEKSIGLMECQDPLTLFQALQKLWREIPWKDPAFNQPFWVGIALFGLLRDDEHNLSLFDEDRRAELARALDKINLKYGKNTLFFGALHDVLESAPTRIAFTQIPSLDDFEA